MMRGSGEEISPEKGIGGAGGGGSKSGRLDGGFWRPGGRTATLSREEGGGVVHLGWSHTDEEETERSMTATLSHREEKMGSAQRALRRRKGAVRQAQRGGGRGGDPAPAATRV
jgi:hypothetical protein